MPVDETTDEATPSIDHVIDELDAGIDPAGVLVIRETRAMRIAGFVICCVLELPVLVYLSVAAFDPKLGLPAVSIGLLFAIPIAIPAIILFQQIAYGTYHYVAMTDRVLIVRAGTAFLEKFSVSDVERFEVRRGVLKAVLNRKPRRVTLMKSSYAPERLSTLAERLSQWKVAPPAHRTQVMAAIDVGDILNQRRKANRLMKSGFLTAIISFIIVASAVLFPQVGARFAFQVMIASFGGFMAAIQFVAGAVMRFTQPAQPEVGSHAEST